MGIDESSPNPHDGEFVRDADGKLTGVCYEQATSVAETAFRASIPDADKPLRIREAVAAAVRTVNSYGITSLQEAVTALGPAIELNKLDREGKLNARVVACAMSRPFIEEGVSGEELYKEIAKLASPKFMPTFTKCFIDGESRSDDMGKEK